MRMSRCLARDSMSGAALRYRWDAMSTVSHVASLDFRIVWRVSRSRARLRSGEASDLGASTKVCAGRHNLAVACGRTPAATIRDLKADARIRYAARESADIPPPPGFQQHPKAPIICANSGVVRGRQLGL